MTQFCENLIVGQGLAGTAIAWTLFRAGQSVFVVDTQNPRSASRVSAGLITPVTGKRLVQSPEFNDEWSSAVQFYKSIETALGCTVFSEQQMLRLFQNEQQREEYLGRSAVSNAELWQGRLQPCGRLQHGLILKPAGRLNVNEYLRQMRLWLSEQGCYATGFADVTQWKSMQPLTISSDTRICSRRLILATGPERTACFKDVPDHPVRGDILKVCIPDYTCRRVVHRSIWIVPHADGTQTVGSTYDWNHVAAEPRHEGRVEILDRLSRLVDGPVKVLDHVAGIRPAMRDYRVVVARHHRQPDVFAVNGLGSKGALRAPAAAAELLALIQGEAPEEGFRYVREQEHELAVRQPLTKRAQSEVARILNRGDIAVDATVGNGFDTAFLAETVGPHGRVLGFDIQAQAIDNTQRRLNARKLQNVRLIRAGHETLLDYTAHNSVRAVMFNLGYLPHGDHSIVTRPKTTVKAIMAALKALQPEGILSVLVYRGHEGGKDEYRAVEQLLTGANRGYDLRRFVAKRNSETSPVLFLVTKRKEKR